MNIRACLYIVVIFFVGIRAGYSISEEEALDSFAAANDSYVEGNIPKALFSYKSLLDKGFESPALYYNLGNAYYKSNKYALSIWSYEKTLLLNPNHKEAKTNLALANRSVSDKIQELPRVAWWYYWQKFKALFPLSIWVLFSVLSVWAACMGLYFFLMNKSPKSRRIGLFMGIVSISFFVFFHAISWHKDHRIKHSNTAIIISTDVYVKNAPEEDGADAFIVHSGLKVHLLDIIGDWYKIRLADGKTGWVKKNEIKNI